jgi:hypothetical protein
MLYTVASEGRSAVIMVGIASSSTMVMGREEGVAP